MKQVITMDNIVNEKWDEILETLKREYEISDVSFNTWLKPLEIHAVEDSLITIVAPDRLHAD